MHPIFFYNKDSFLLCKLLSLSISRNSLHLPSSSYICGSQLAIMGAAFLPSPADTSATADQTIPPRYPLVEVTPLANQAVQVHVECRKQPGLLVRLMTAVEAAGLLLLDADIAVRDDILKLHAVGVQAGVELVTIDDNVLKSSLLQIILNVSNDVSTIRH
eukprot:c20615_g1_i3 orf=95-574(+)